MEWFCKDLVIVEIFFKVGVLLYLFGEILKQLDFVWILQLIVDNGFVGFYQGEIVGKIVVKVQMVGGSMIEQDLVDYQLVWCDLVIGGYCGYEIVFMLLLFLGGVYIVQILNMLEVYFMWEFGFNLVNVIYVMVEVKCCVYVDCLKYLGDLDYFDILVFGLMDLDYVVVLVQQIDQEVVIFLSDVVLGNLIFYESN